ncbi:hypothetical protein JK211_14460 [Tatumella sp. JGM130]|uniref:hypothetical protein n=1 Tax=Tatumella sp. JGM130 TaxID=2799797 RepID=UPI001BAF3CC6|nr:hypothetical protein [Tatumella sp. JGM130]MBS0895217.1 hypothetical protein [Tatumella sp. JGM130]
METQLLNTLFESLRTLSLLTIFTFALTFSAKSLVTTIELIIAMKKNNYVEYKKECERLYITPRFFDYIHKDRVNFKYAILTMIVCSVCFYLSIEIITKILR